MSRRTVRLPIRGGKAMKRRISARIAIDNELFAHAEDVLLDRMPDPFTVNVFDMMVESVREFTAQRGFDEEWATSRVSVAGSLTVRYRSEWKRLLAKSKKRFGNDGKVTRNAMSEAIDSSVGGWGVYSPLALKHNFGRDWKEISAELMPLVVSGDGEVTVNVFQVGDFTVRGAGPHPDFGDGEIVSAALEERAGRYYLNITVEVKIESDKRFNRDVEEFVKVVLTPATMAADDRGVALAFPSESSAIWKSRRRVLRVRDEGKRVPRKLNRKLMNQRYNWYKQYATSLVVYARENDMGIEINANADALEHPRILTMNRSMRSIFMRTIMSIAFKNGVYVKVSNNPQDIQFSRCEHRSLEAVTGVLRDREVIAMCGQCASKNVVV